MKKIILITLFIAAIAAGLLTSCATAKRMEERIMAKTNPLLGTWELKLYKYGYGNDSFNEFPEGRRQIQLITEDYFTWVRVDTTSKKIYGSATGKYSYDGNNFIVNVDYGLGMDMYLGIQSHYTVKVENDYYFLTGELVDGYKIEEIWERVK